MCVRVVNVKGLNKAEQRKGIVYVGRAWAGWAHHPLHNPFRPKTGLSLGQCLDSYGEHLAAMPDLEERLADLWEQCEHGAKPLGCWCCESVAGDGSLVVCHAQILAEALRVRFCGK